MIGSRFVAASTHARRLPPASRHSIPSGDVVLCNLPPYSTQPWLSMGVVLHAALLAGAGIRARVVRPLDPPFVLPELVHRASLATLTFDPPMEARLAAMEEAYRASPRFFDALVDELLAGPEEVVGLSLFRNNADVSLWVAKLVKERRPSAFVILGGPEAVEEPAALLLPWIDAVVGADAEAVVVALVRALLDRRPDRAAALRNVWVSPAIAPSDSAPSARAPLPAPPLPVIDYAPIMRLLVGDEQPTVPMLLNWGCPYSCSFCSNRGIYSRFEQGRVGRVLAEMDVAVASWRALHDGAPPGLSLQLSDATTNAIPAQLDELLRGVVDRAKAWGQRPLLRGQTLFDTRLTAERVRLMAEANFGNTFFGLDAANDGQRRSLQKPGNLAQVAQAMELWHRGIGGGLTFGVPVGIPGETEAQFREAERFVEWALGMASSIESITVLPYVWFLSAQGPGFVQQNRGARRGVLWRAGVPGGDPEVRARRFMRLFEVVAGRASVVSPIPPYLALPAMLPDEDPARIEAFMQRFGREFDQIGPPAKAVQREAARPKITAAWSRAQRAIEAAEPLPGWTREGLEWRASGEEVQALVALYRRGDGGERVAVVVEPHDSARRSFTRTRHYNVSYLKQWQGVACGFDEGLVRRCARDLERAEAVDEP